MWRCTCDPREVRPPPRVVMQHSWNPKFKRPEVPELLEPEPEKQAKLRTGILAPVSCHGDFLESLGGL